MHLTLRKGLYSEWRINTSINFFPRKREATAGDQVLQWIPSLSLFSPEVNCSPLSRRRRIGRSQRSLYLNIFFICSFWSREEKGIHILNLHQVGGCVKQCRGNLSPIWKYVWSHSLRQWYVWDFYLPPITRTCGPWVESMSNKTAQLHSTQRQLMEFPATGCGDGH